MTKCGTVIQKRKLMRGNGRIPTLGSRRTDYHIMTEVLYGFNGTIARDNCSSQEDPLQQNPVVHNYNHQGAMDEVDKMNKQLESLKESLIRSSVRCHILEVDLATQFSPDIQNCLRETQQDCEKCVKCLADILESNQSTEAEDIENPEVPAIESNDECCDLIADTVMD